jgi:hypothetical protein
MQYTQEIMLWFRGSISNPLPDMRSEEELLAWLTDYCNDLLKRDFPALVQLLYRVDVSEQRLKYMLKMSGGADAGNTMANLMLERVVQIVQSRKKYRMPEEDIPEEERW